MSLELFGKTGSKDDVHNSSQMPKVNSSIMNAAGFAFNQAKHKDFPSTDKAPIIHSRPFSEALNGNFRGMKAFISDITESIDQSDSPSSSSDEIESSDSSMTRVDRNNNTLKPKVKASSIINTDIDNTTQSFQYESNQHREDTNNDTVPKKARAKVSSNMIISDFSNIRLPPKQEHDDDLTLFSPPAWSEVNQTENRYDNSSGVSQTIDQGRNNAVRRPRVISEEPSSIATHRSEFNYTRSGTRSDVSWGSDPGAQNTNTRKTILRPDHDVNDLKFSKSERINNYPSGSRSEVVYRKDQSQVSSRAPKVKATSYNYQDEMFSRNVQPQSNPRYNTKSPPSTPKTWSEVTYRTPEARTEVSHRSDPGSHGHAIQRYPTAHVASRVPSVIEEHDPYFQSYQPSKSHKPKVSMDAMMDVSNALGNKPKRRVTTSAQMSTAEDGHGSDYDDNESTGDIEEENCVEDPDDRDQEELDELMSLSSDPKIQRKFLDLRISIKSLTSLNASLDTTVKEQSTKLASIPSIETIVSVQQQQLEYINRVEELMRGLSTRITEQDSEIKNLKGQTEATSEEKQKARVTLFYDPRLFPLNSLPRIIFDRVYDDIAILFIVIASLLYTIYIFPVVVMAKSARKLADKSRAKIQEITG